MMNDMILLAQPTALFEEQVVVALKSLREGDLLALAASPLAQSSLVESYFLSGEPITADTRGRIVRSLLRWAIERLRPEGEQSWIKPAWRNYCILHYFYLEGMRASALAEAMAIAEQTLYQVRPLAINALSNLLRSELQQPSDEMGRRAMVYRDRYARQSSEQQQLLRIAAVFPGAVPSRLLHGLANRLGILDPLPALQQLALNHLMSRDEVGGEQVVHPQLRNFLLTLLSPEERHLAHRAAAEHYTAQHNFLEAAQQWRAGDQAERAAQLLIEHQRDIIDNLQLEELAELLSRFRPSDLSAATWARLKILAGEIAEFTENFSVALAEYQQALGSPDLHTKALAYYRRAKAFEHTNIDESLAHYARCIQLLEKAAPSALAELDRVTLLGNVYIDRAWLQMQVRPDLQRAENDLLCARALLEATPQLHDRPIWGNLHNALGEFYHRTGKPELAVDHTWQAWLAANEARDLERMSKTAHNLGLVYMDDLQQYDRALEYLRKSEELAQQTGNRPMEGLSAMSIGACHYWRRDLAAAIEQYELAATIFRESGNRTLLARTLYGLAEAHAELGNRNAARQYHQEGTALALTLGDQGALRDYESLAQLHQSLFAETVELSDRQQKALAHVQEYGQITNREYQELTGVAQKQTVRDLNELVEAKLLQRKGSGRATRYVLVSAS
ncbi:MAG: tetratricopeptide repeat protein [Caldilineaceae bacterium]